MQANLNIDTRRASGSYKLRIMAYRKAGLGFSSLLLGWISPYLGFPLLSTHSR